MLFRFCKRAHLFRIPRVRWGIPIPLYSQRHLKSIWANHLKPINTALDFDVFCTLPIPLNFFMFFFVFFIFFDIFLGALFASLFLFFCATKLILPKNYRLGRVILLVTNFICAILNRVIKWCLCYLYWHYWNYLILYYLLYIINLKGDGVVDPLPRCSEEVPSIKLQKHNKHYRLMLTNRFRFFAVNLNW